VEAKRKNTFYTTHRFYYIPTAFFRFSLFKRILLSIWRPVRDIARVQGVSRDIARVQGVSKSMVIVLCKYSDVISGGPKTCRCAVYRWSHSDIATTWWWPIYKAETCSCIFHIALIWVVVPRRNVPDFGRVFLMLKYTDITQNTCVQSWTVTEIMAREKCGLLAGPRTVPFSWRSYPYPSLSVVSYYGNSAHARSKLLMYFLLGDKAGHVSAWHSCHV